MDNMHGHQTNGALRAALIAIFIVLAALSAAGVSDHVASERESTAVECC